MLSVMIKLQYFFIFFISISSSTISQKPINCDRSCPGGAFDLIPVPYPFGFSTDCQIQLNCTSNGTVLIGEFPVQQIDSQGLHVGLPAKCGRSVDALSQLYSEHYAPMSTNGLLMQNCTGNMDCMIAEGALGTGFEIRNCSGGSGSITCYTQNDARMFLDYENVTRTGCRFLFSGVDAEVLGGSQGASSGIQVVKLGWWLKGSCDCSGGANCTQIVSPVDGGDGYRCNCKSGFIGDGYKASSGCRKMEGSMGASHKRNLKLKLVIGLSGGMAGILMLLLFVIKKWLWEPKKSADHQLEIFISNYKRLTPKRFKYSEIKKMTKSFLEKLGQGGYGSVYKGELPDGQLVAVKVLSKSIGDGTDFINEVASISRTSHINIVTLLGFCIEGKKRALMYEFMANGSLDKFLHSGGPRLDWNTLFLIAKGIARGLEYLHQGCNTRIVHFDIKPHNILLDEEFVPKISDFGLANLCRKKESIVSLMDARGTAGYMAPEVFFKSLGGASHKADVYSYGMMVLEMTGARKNNNVNLTSASEAYFPDWIYKQVETRGSLEDYGVTTKEEEELARKMLIVSLWCVQSDPSDRPSISKVVEMFEGSIESLQVPPRNFWSSSSTRSAQGAFSLVTQSSTSERLLTVQAIGKDLSS